MPVQCFGEVQCFVPVKQAQMHSLCVQQLRAGANTTRVCKLLTCSVTAITGCQKQESVLASVFIDASCIRCGAKNKQCVALRRALAGSARQSTGHSVQKCLEAVSARGDAGDK